MPVENDLFDFADHRPCSWNDFKSASKAARSPQASSRERSSHTP
jgi:hypothetical protein